MDECFTEANLAFAEREVPVGCAIVDDTGCVLSTGRNETNRTRNSTRHAEIVALSKVPHDRNLTNCTIYVTIEPCIMCAAALSIVGLTKVIYFAKNEKFGGCGTVLDVSAYAKSPWSKINAQFVPDERAVNLLQAFFERRNPMTNPLLDADSYNTSVLVHEEPSLKIHAK